MKTSFSKILPALVAATACIALVTGCKSRETATGRLTVTAMLAPQATLIREIAGDSVQVNTLIGTGVNPESYEPSVSAMRQVAQSDLLMLSGALGFEQQLVERLHDSNPSLTVHDTSAGITPIYGTHSHPHHEHGEGHEHEHSVADPHTWTSVKNARVMAANIHRILCDADPALAPYYTERYHRLDHHLDSLDRALTLRLAPLEGKGFLIWHPSLSYLARDYGLRQIPIGAEGKEITPRALKQIIDRANLSGCRVLFVQADFDSSRAEAISRQTGANVVTITPLDPDWESQIILIADGLANNL